MARRKKQKTKRISFKRGASKSKKQRTLSLKGVLKVLAIILLLAAAGAVFYFGEKYVKYLKPFGTGPLELAYEPEWASIELKARIYEAAGGKTFRLNENVAQEVAENLATVAWLDNVKVQTTHSRLLIIAEWRKPLALVQFGSKIIYLDNQMVVLDFVPIFNLPIVRIEGLPTAIKIPPPGEVWESDEITAAITILAKLDQMDKSVTPDKPLLYDIDRIDISNFNGHKNSRAPHVVLYAKDNTEIIWGAEFGTWQRHLETTDEKKLAKLYAFYKKHGSLLGGVKYINLCDPQDNISQPIDKY